MSAEEELYCSKCGEWRGQERYTCRQGGESVPKPAKQEAMSAEDRAATTLEDLFMAGRFPKELIFYRENALDLGRDCLEALSSEGLVVVARGDVLTPTEASALLRATGDGRLPDLDVPEAELSGCVKLRRLSGADQDG